MKLTVKTNYAKVDLTLNTYYYNKVENDILLEAKITFGQGPQIRLFGQIVDIGDPLMMFFDDVFQVCFMWERRTITDPYLKMVGKEVLVEHVYPNMRGNYPIPSDNATSGIDRPICRSCA